MSLHLPLARRDNSLAGALARLRRREPAETPRPALVFPLGVDVDTGEVAGLPGMPTCPFVLTAGATNTGKSYGTELNLCRLLYARHKAPDKAPGFLLLDPHNLARRTLRRLAEFQVPPEQVLLLELDNPACLPAFQPLACDGASVAYQVGANLKACAKVWGQEVFDATPLLKRWMKNVLWPCIEAGCAPSEFEALLSLADEEPLRDALLARCSNPAVLRAWRQEFVGYKSVARRMDCLGSTINRLEVYYENPFLRRLFGQTDPRRVIDWRAVLDQGKYVIVTLAGGNQLAADDVTLVGVLLLNEVLRAAKRPPFRLGARPFYVIADEFQRVANRDFMEMLCETRKFGLRGWFSLQDPTFLKEHDPALYWATLTNARAKLLFAGVHTGELEPLVRDAYAATFDPNLVKFDNYRTYFHPHEETRTVPSAMRAKTHSHGTVASWNDVRMEAAGSAYAQHLDGLWLPGPTGAATLSSGHNSAHASGHGGAEVSTDADTAAQGEATVPFYRLEVRRELSSRQFRDLNEQLQMAVNRTHSLPNQHCLLVVPGQKPRVVRVFDLPEPRVTDAEVEAYRQAVFAQACYATPEEVDRQIAQRQRLTLTEPRLKGAEGKTLSGLEGAELPPPDPVAALRERVRRLDPTDTDARDELLRHLAQLALQARKPLLEQLTLKLRMPKAAVREAMKQALAAPPRAPAALQRAAGKRAGEGRKCRHVRQ